jgi:uncharacterized membrane protein HdeD (DUF308 family)
VEKQPPGSEQMVKASKQPKFWHSRWGMLVIGVVALAMSYLLASKAIDTGSLQQYAMTFILLGLAIWFLIRGLKTK